MNRCRFVLLSTCLCMVSLTCDAKTSECLSYASKIVKLSGVISKRTDFGPPGFGEDPKHDSKESHLYLTLDRKVCVNAPPNDLDDENEANVGVMEMVYFVRVPFRKEWMGRHVLVTGTLFHSFSGHHHTAVLITPTATDIIGESKSL